MNTQKKALVIEDEKSLSSIIKDKLENRGFTVSLAVSVEEGIDYLEKSLSNENPFLFVWLDHYLMGKKSGLDFLSKMRNELKLSIPVFVVTNTAGHEKKSTYLKFGATKYYIKATNKLADIADDIEKELPELQE